MKLAPETNEAFETSTNTNEYQKFEAQLEADNNKQRLIGALILVGVLAAAFGLLYGSAYLTQLGNSSVQSYLETDGSAN